MVLRTTSIDLQSNHVHLTVLHPSVRPSVHTNFSNCLLRSYFSSQQIIMINIQFHFISSGCCYMYLKSSLNSALLEAPHEIINKITKCVFFHSSICLSWFVELRRFASPFFNIRWEFPFRKPVDFINRRFVTVQA